MKWGLNGKELTNASGDQRDAELIPSETGGAIITWQDDRNGNSDIYAQRIDSNGDSLWEENGMVISDANNSQRYMQMVMNAEDNIFIVWEDRRNLNSDIYMQMIKFSVPNLPEPINILLILLIVGLIGVISIIGIIYVKKKKSKTIKAEVRSPTE